MVFLVVVKAYMLLVPVVAEVLGSFLYSQTTYSVEIQIEALQVHAK